jgi:hypothetical protein
MKKMSILIVAILILGCETETPMVEQPLSISEAPSPVAASGEHFRVDIVEPTIVWSTIDLGEVGVDPNPLHFGIEFEFGEDLKLYKIDLRLDGGQSLGWLPRGVVDDKDIGRRIWLIPAPDSPMLEFDTAYVIGLYVQDLGCWSTKVQWPFRTKPKP